MPYRVHHSSIDAKFPLLSLPQSVRVKIWNILGFSHTKTLRLVCHKIKEDIDTAAGISSAIDSTFEDFPFHCKIAIRKLAIHEMIKPAYLEFIKYPLSLHELEIRGEITEKTFFYIIKSCPNLCKILIVFNKFVVEHKSNLFPLPQDVLNSKNNPLSKLSSIKIISTTKKLVELAYVYKVIVGLLNDVMGYGSPITFLQILMAHRGPHVNFSEVMMTTMLLVHKNTKSLRYLNLMFRDRDPHALSEGSEMPRQSQAGQQQDESDSSTRKDSVMPGVKIPKAPPKPKPQAAPAPPKPPQPHPTKSQPQKRSLPESQAQRKSPPGLITQRKSLGRKSLPHTHKDVHVDVEPKPEMVTDDTNEINPEGEGEADLSTGDSEGEETNERISSINRFLADNPWTFAPYLHIMVLSVPYKIMNHLVNIVGPQTTLESLNLEAIGSLAHHPNNWNLYQKFLSQGNMKLLKSVAFHHVSNDDEKGHSIPLDLKIFKKCKSLNKISILCEKKDDFERLPRAKHLSSLPSTLNEVHFERLLLVPCQVFRLVFCYSRMREVSIAYWSISDCQFRFLCILLKYTIKLDMTDCQRINLVDTKIRFRNNRKAVIGLQEALDISTKYHDVEETKLVINTDRKKVGVSGYAPRISILKAEPRHSRTYMRKTFSHVDKKGTTRAEILNLAKLYSTSSRTSLY